MRSAPDASCSSSSTPYPTGSASTRPATSGSRPGAGGRCAATRRSGSCSTSSSCPRPTRRAWPSSAPSSTSCSSPPLAASSRRPSRRRSRSRGASSWPTPAASGCPPIPGPDTSPPGEAVKLMRLGPVGAERPVVRIDDDDVRRRLGRRAPTSTRPSSARAASTGCVTSSPSGRRPAHGDVRRRADRRPDRPAPPDPLHRPQLQRPRRRDRPGRPDEPILFTKSPNTIVGPNDDVRHPARLDQDRLGGRARHRHRHAHLLPGLGRGRGSRRDRRLRRWSTTSASAPSRWSAAGSGRRASPPRRSTRPGRGWSRPTRSTTSLSLRHVARRQRRPPPDGSTATMVFDPYFIVHHLSQFMVLEPGDLINTGTPPGVGLGFDPPVWLAAGRRDGAGHRRARDPAPDRDRAPLTCAPSSSPVPAAARSRTSPDPRPAPDEVVVDVARVGICGTDVEFFTGEMEYLHEGLHHLSAASSATSGAEPSPRSGATSTSPGSGRRVTGDTMLGCGACRRCRSGRHHVCETRSEIGIRRRLPGRPRRAPAGSGHRAACPCRTPSTTPRERWSSPAATRSGPSRRRRSSPARGCSSSAPATIGILAAQFARRGRCRGPSRRSPGAGAGVRPGPRPR